MKSNQPLLEVRDLRVDVADHHVLKSASFDVPAAGVTVLMGANGSGKSTLGLTLAGHPRYQVVGGQVRFAGADLLALDPAARARAGLFVSFQTPPDVPGVKTSLFLRTALNAVRAARGEPPLDAYDFLGSMRQQAAALGLPEKLLNRPVNEGFSGGERKRNELLQLALLQPRLAVLDEIDSGLDVDGMRMVVDFVRAQCERGTAFLVVSHYLQMIEALAPDAVLRLDEGCIAETGGIELARRIADEGFTPGARATEAVAA